jgi:hypothetical protein
LGLRNCRHSWNGVDPLQERGEALSPTAAQAQAENRGAAGRTEDCTDDEGGAPDRAEMRRLVAKDVSLEQLHQVEEKTDQTDFRQLDVRGERPGTEHQ